MGEAGQARMQDYDQNPLGSVGLVLVWCLVGLVALLVLAFGAWRLSASMPTHPRVEVIYDACVDDYGENACRCFSGVMSVQLSRLGYRTYVEGLQSNRDRRFYFDGGLAEQVLSGRDHRVCVDASDICGVRVCEPRVPTSTSSSYDTGFDGSERRRDGP